jgi:hypothetical protein
MRYAPPRAEWGMRGGEPWVVLTQGVGAGGVAKPSSAFAGRTAATPLIQAPCAFATRKSVFCLKF